MNHRSIRRAGLALFLALAAPALSRAAEACCAVRPDGHAPIGVMGDHTHVKGEWMTSYRYGRMEMDGLRQGTGSIGEESVLDRYMMAPRSMSMNMHMVGAMGAPVDRLTLAAMVPYKEIAMTSVDRMGRETTRRTQGLGDARAAAMIVLRQWDSGQIHLNAGLSLPTGSTDETVPGMNGRQRLPSGMQLGSGTWDLLPGITYTGHGTDWSWGGQAMGTVRLGRNDEDYSLGDRYDATAWLARRWCAWFSSSARLGYAAWSGIDGADDALNPMMAPGADTRNSGGRRVNLGLGGNFLASSGILQGHRLGIEFELPVHQDVDGIQLKADWALNVGWQKTW